MGPLRQDRGVTHEEVEEHQTEEQPDHQGGGARRGAGRGRQEPAAPRGEQRRHGVTRRLDDALVDPEPGQPRLEVGEGDAERGREFLALVDHRPRDERHDQHEPTDDEQDGQQRAEAARHAEPLEQVDDRDEDCRCDGAEDDRQDDRAECRQPEYDDGTEPQHPQGQPREDARAGEPVRHRQRRHDRSIPRVRPVLTPWRHTGTANVSTIASRFSRIRSGGTRYQAPPRIRWSTSPPISWTRSRTSSGVPAMA